MNNFFITVFYIFSSYRYTDAFKLIVSYFKLLIRNRLSISNTKKERFLNFIIEFPYRPAFFGLITEIFFRPLTSEEGNLDSVTIIDCGTNIGIRMFYYKWLYPNATILCFEPNPLNLDYLYRNINNNRLTGIKVYPFAVGSKNNKTRLFYNDNIRGLGSGTVFKSLSESSNKYSIEVNVVKLSDYIKESIYLLKLDIEGSEGEVIDDLEENGSFQLISRIVIEFHYDGVTMIYPLPKIIKKLEDAGYVCRHTPLVPPVSVLKVVSQTCIIHANKK